MKEEGIRLTYLTMARQMTGIQLETQIKISPRKKFPLSAKIAKSHSPSSCSSALSTLRYPKNKLADK
jgi:hypothetical protein